MELGSFMKSITVHKIDLVINFHVISLQE